LPLGADDDERNERGVQMGNVNFYLYPLMGFMLIGSLIAVETGDLLSSVICVGAVGFALAVVDLMVGAPDLAITQVAVEIVCVVMLIRMVITRRDQHHATSHDTLAIGATVLCLAAVVAICAFCFSQPQMREFGDPLLAQQGAPPVGDQQVPAGVGKEYLARTTANVSEPGRTGAANAVTAVLLDYRAYDTLGEATVIFTSIIGAYVVLRAVGRKKESGALETSA
jgi:multisubunit Na+/H+ antiporter MnhB subunit